MSLRNFIRRTHLLIQHGLHESRRTSGPYQHERGPEVTRLEERLLFSASAIGPIAVEMADAAGARAASFLQPENSGQFSLTDGQLLDMVAETVLPPQSAAADESSAQATDEQTLELVFLDSSISNLDQMMADLRGDSADDPLRNLEFVVLDSEKDGIAQITSTLLTYNGVDGLHIVSQGESGTVQLGSTTLSLENLDRYRTAIGAWQHSLSDKAEILIYGTGLEAFPEGRQLLNEISFLVGTTAESSDNLTDRTVLRSDSTAASVRHELVILDPGVQNSAELLDLLLAQQEDGRDLEIFVLDANRDGVEQIAAILAQQNDLDAVHVLSHGTSAGLQLGNTWLDARTINDYAETIRGWQGAFGSDADLLLYGCDLAANSAGRSLIDTLGQWTGTDIAASTDLTGYALFGGDWQLEYQTGQLETHVVAGTFEPSQWQGLMAISVNSTSFAATAGAASSLTWSHTITSGSNRILTVNLSLTSGQSTGVTYGGTAMALVGRFSGANSHTSEIWQLLTPTVGTANVIATFSASQNALGGAVAFNDVNQTTPTGSFQGASGDSGTASVTVSSAAGEVVIDTLFVDLSTAVTAGAGQTEQWELTNGRTGAGSTEAGAASVVMSWTLGSPDEWNIGAVSLKPHTGPAAPTIGNLAGDALTYQVGSGAAVIDQIGNASVSDSDSPDFNSGSLTVSFAAGSDSAEDVLAIRNQGTGAGQIGISGTNVIYGGTTIGTFTGGSGGANLVITLNANSNVTNMAALIQNITYQNTDGSSPTGGARTVRFVLNDGDGQTSANYDATVNVPGASNTLVVTTTSDVSDGTVTSIAALIANKGADGVISLREAIAATNNTAGTDFIQFSISGAGPHQIDVASALPTINQSLIIDGLSEPDYAGTPVVRIDGAAAGFGGISIGAGGGGSTIRGVMITGFTGDGINVASGANNVTIADNWIGTAGTGTSGHGNANVGNTDDGLDVYGSNAFILRNVITNNNDEGIDIKGSGVTSHVIQGNYIGLDPDGSTSVNGNNDVGIAIISGTGNTIGGTTVADRNLISMNNEGMEINTSNNIVLGNYIGTDVSGTVHRGNRIGDGVQIQGSSTNNQVGGTAAGAGNLIAYNAGDGVEVVNGSGDLILGNAIYSNTLLGINLGTAGITANDAGDADTGANNLQNFPVLTSATAAAAGTTIVGSLNSNASTTYRIEFYANRPSIADTSYGEGERYLGFVTVTTDGSGNATINTTLTNVWINAGDKLSATATVDLGGGSYSSTSEFGANITATSTGIVVVDTISDVSDGTTTSITNLGNARGADGRISLREAIAATNATAGADTIVFNIAGTGVHTINVLTALPTITGSVSIDATTDDSFAANGNRPAIILDGNDGNFAGLVIGATGDGSTIKGLVIRDFGSYGLHIAINSDGNTIVGNYIGGLSAGGVSAGAGENNGDSGIYVRGSNNTIGGASPALRNVISGNSRGIFVWNASSNNIQGNFIGTDAAGTTLIGNFGEGIQLRGATNTQIGGTAANAGNVLAGAEWEGIWLWDGTTGTVVEGNFIGTDITGTLNLGNVASGINIGNYGPPSTGNRIGGTAAGAGNLIAFNGRSGVEVDQNVGGASTGNPILGNSFHANAGIAIDLDGFDADPSSAGVTANDPGDADVGGNNRQNFPVLTEATTTGAQVTFTGTLNSTASTQFRIEFFASTAQDGSGYGEGQRYLGYAEVTTDGSGNATINATLAVAVSAGEFISATATKSNAGFTAFTDTSEFAQNLTAIIINTAPTYSSGDGLVTTNFGAGSTDFAYSTAIQPDGKILVAGYSTAAGTQDFALVRYNADGSLDTSFGGGDGMVSTAVGASNDIANGVTVLSNGKILLVGNAVISGSNQIALVQYNADGSLDTSFGGGDGIAISGIVGSEGNSIAVQADGKLVVGGTISSNFLVARFNGDGTLDTGFGSSGSTSVDFNSGSDTGYSVAIQSDGKIVMSGRAFNGTSFDFGLARFSTTGTLDTAFDGDGKVLTDIGTTGSDAGYRLTLQSDGKIVVAGWSDAAGTTDFALARYNTNGSLDTSFSGDGKLTTAIGSGGDLGQAVTVQSDGKIIVAGQSSSASNNFGVVRYLADGTLDTTFNGTGIIDQNFGGSSDDRASGVIVQNDGKILVAGTSTLGGDYDFAIARYTTTGAIDTRLDLANTLNGTPTITEGGSAVVLDSNVMIFDAELSALNNFSGATLTLVRNGGASAQDVYSATGTLSVLTQGGSLIVGGTTVGTVTTNGSGTLLLNFNASATNALVNSAMQQIAYSNNSDAPPASAQINWTFNDGNSGAQGTGGALQATGSTVVSINAVNDPPVITSNGAGASASLSVTENSTAVTTVTASDVDGGTAVYSIGGGADAAKFVINSSSGALTFVAAPDFESPTDSGVNNVYEVIVQVSDGSLTDTQAIAVSVTDVASGAVIVTTTSDVNDGDVSSIEALNQNQGADGVISLREAILAANATSGADSISFSIAGIGVKTISVTAALPTITDSVTIDGYTQSGASVNTLDVGTDAVLLIEISGTNVSANAYGLNVYTSSSTIRGLVINDFTYAGIGLNGGSGNIIQGNYIGTNAAGTTAIGNGRGTQWDGITFGDQASTSNNVIGGTTVADRNVISGNYGGGVWMTGSAGGNTVQGNYIGTNAAGTSAIGNAQHGVILTGSGNSVIGNVIGGNGGGSYYGIYAPTSADSTIIQSNLVGVGADGITAIGNSSHGIYLESDGNLIGGLTAGLGNTIANNSGKGIVVTNTAQQNGIYRNSIYGNSGVGIDLGTSGVTVNNGTMNSQANSGMDFPLLTVASLSGNTLDLAGFVGSASGQVLFAGARVEIFKSDGDSTGYGEGRTYVGFLTTDSSGNFAGQLTVSGLAAGDKLTATASDASNNTSEFGLNIVVNNSAPLLAGANNLISINEDPTSNPGTLVSALIAGQITDGDAGASTGIAVTAVDNTNGTWQYSTNGGGGWSNFGSPSATTSRLLTSNASTIVRFVPTANWNGSSSLTFRAWDQTTGTAAGTANTNASGGNTAYSSATAAASLTVNAVNDAPVATITPTTYAATEQVSLTLKNTGLSISDVDAAAGSMTVTLSVTEGTLNVTTGDSGAVVTNSGSSSVTITGSVTQINSLLSTDATSTMSYIDNTDTPSASATLTLLVNDNGNTGGGSLTNSDTATINITAVNDPPAITSNGGGATASLSVAENTTAVTTVTSADVDGGTPIYSISGGADALKFSIDGNTGVLTFALAPDFELPTDVGGNNVYDVQVTVSDGAGGTDTQDIAVTVTNMDEGGVSAISDTNAAADTVAENSAIGTTVGVSANATDPDGTDTVTYALDDDAAGRFTIHATTGIVTVAGALDSEAAASHDITIRATSSDTSFTTLNVTINISDVDEFDTGAVTDSNATANAVAENAANGTVVNITALASDADATTNTITYSLQDSDGGRFTIDANTGIVTVNGAINRETDGASRNITVRATSTDTSFSDQVFTININDVDEFDVTAPIDTNAAANAVNENAANGTVVGVTANAGDADATTNTVTYSLTDNAGGRFAIDANTGVVTVADGTLLNRELAASHNITVRATSTDTSTADTVFTININDVDEFDVTNPVDSNAAANVVNENAVNGTVVGVTANASDADATNNTVTYTLTDDAGGRFAIDANTGVVTVADGTLLNRELAASHNITVRATSADTSFSDQVFTININDVDEFDVTNPVDSNAAANTVAEDATVGTTVGLTASAGDADATTNTVTYSLTDNAGGRFAIDGVTGVVTVAGALDYETNTSHTVTVRATSADGSFATQVFTINVTNVNEGGVGPVSEVNAAANTVAENSVVGTAVGVTANATDPDVSDTVTYSLDDTAGGRFAIDSSTGIVTVAGAVDREAAGSYSITIRATSSDTSFTTLILSININDVDEFDVTAPIDTNAAANAVNENAANGTVVGVTANASDADATNNTVTYTLSDNAGGRFAIDANTGVVTVADGTLLNRELAASHNITVRATSADTSFSDQVFTININDVDEFDVTNPVDSNAAANTVAEDATVGTTVGLTASAGDADATTNTVTYSLTDNAGGRFAIDGVTGVVTVAGALDYETNTSHTVTVRATSADGSFATQVFTINVTNVNEGGVGPVSEVNAAANTVAENSVVGTAVGVTANATDPDITDTVTYSLDDTAGGRFAIDSSTGIVTVAGAVDREAAGSYSITIRATSSDTSFTTLILSININDVDEFDVTNPVDANAAANVVNENAVNGTVVGVTANAGDADATTNTVTYSLTDNAGGRFAIDANTGVVTVADGTLLNRELAASHNITVRATSADTSFSDQVFTININDVDEFDVTNPVDSNAAANTVAEDATVGTTVGLTASAGDADATTNTVTYSLTDNAGGRFAIDGVTGVVTVAAALDYETNTSHTVTVRATSADGSFATQVFTINVTNVNEGGVGPVSEVNAAANTVAENSVVGTAVGVTANATDPDVSDTVTYSLDDTAGGRFAIDSSTGIVTVAGAVDREAAGSYSITIRATSSDTSFTTLILSININDVDEFDVTNPVDANAAANVVNENAANGTVVGVTANASDADATNNTVTYTLTDDAGGRFAIDANTGVVTVADGTLLNRELAASHNITVRATSTDTSTADTVFTININDVDEFDVTNPVDANAAANAVNENAANGTVVGVTANAGDSDATNNVVTYSLTDNAGGRFAIDENTGVVTVADGTLLNRETAASHNITVRATSTDTSVADTVFTINITDIDEFDTGAVTDANAAANSVAENASIGTAVGITASTSDADATTNAITYTLDNSAGGLFAIDANTGIVTVNAVLDYETATSHNITVRATSADSSFSTQSFTINLTDVSEGGVSAVSDSDGSANTVLENASNGTTVSITGLATDPDGADIVTYSLDDNAGGRFTIDTNTGVVTVNGAIDREAAASYNITIRATSTDTSTTTQTFTINIGDIDEFDTGAVTDSNSTANSLAENAANGTVVNITSLATDADATTNTITYSLFDNDGGRFAINLNSGVVSVAGAIDREADGSSRSITIRATSADGSFTDQAFSIAIVDTDEFDVTTPNDTNATSNAIDENVSIGTVVEITAASSDADVTNNAVTYSLFDNDGGNFTIDANTGIVTTAAALNRETLGASRNITVRATSTDGSTADTVFAIAINDLDEFNVGSVTDSNATANTIAENSANGTAVNITGLASDADATTNTITYSLDDNAGGRFTIDANTGVVIVANSSLLNYEAATSHSITIRATSADTSFSTQAFTINLTDVNEGAVSSVTDSNSTANYVLENAGNGTTVEITGLATDPDGTDTVTYSLDDNAGGRFAIDTNTGVVTVNGAIDREAAASHNITIRATSADTTSSTQSFTIAIGDVDEFNTGVVADNSVVVNSVVENATVGTNVGITAVASDADATTNAITYSLQDNDGGRFAINANSGVVTVAGAIDREADGSSRNITVRATSADGSFTDQAFSIAIVDADEFNVTAPTDSNATANAVDENVSIGTVVGITAFSSDADATTNTITYTLFDNDGGNFTIDASTGIVTTAAALNRETLGASRNITVRATSADGSTADTVFTININDLDEFNVGAVTDSNATANTIAENSANGTAVSITGLASDADATINTITYSLDDNAGGRFTIDANTGVVTVANSSLLNYEAATSHSITIRATSADTSFSTQAFTINLNDQNDSPPAIAPGQQFSLSEVSSDGTVVGDVVATDPDGVGTLQNWTITGGNSGGVFGINPTTGQMSVVDVSQLNFESTSAYTLTLTVFDGVATSVPATVQILVVDAGEAPVFTAAPTMSVQENSAVGTVVGSVGATDPDASDSLTYSIAGGNPLQPFAIDSVTGQITVFTPALLDFESVGSIVLTVQVTDSGGLLATQNVNVSLGNLNETPAGLTLDGGVVTENSTSGTFVAALTGADPDSGDTLVYGLTDSAGGRFVIDTLTGIVTVANVAELNFETADSWSITARVTDTAGLYIENVFLISVTDVNEAPQAVADQFTTMQFSSLSVVANGVLFNDSDPDGGVLQAFLVSGPAFGSLILNFDGSLTYTPSGAYSGIDSFSYVASDGALSGSIVSVTVNVLSTVGSDGSDSGGTGGTGTTSDNGGTSGDGGDTSGGSSSGGDSESESDDDRDVRYYGGPSSSQNSPRDRNWAEPDLAGADKMVAEETTMTAQMQQLFLVAEFTETADAIGDLRRQNPAANTIDRALGRIWGDSTFVVDSIDAIVAAGFFRIDQDAGDHPHDGTDTAFGGGDKFMVGSTAVVTTSLSVGYVMWILRGGSLLTAFMSALPAWHAFDPLPVLKSFERRKEEEDDSLLTLVTRKAASAVKRVVSR